MTEARIVVDHIWKKFRRGQVHDSLRDLIPATLRRVAGRGPRADDLTGQDFWAVRDLSFEVRPGEALGIIGANGSGKSTTLKLLTKILRPTRGRCAVQGRIGALIEIAAGFHGDLTGRENIFLQGAIMGMRVKDITRKFTDIVDFSGIGEFIDTPVKRYSSGMNARLGFAIAAHLDPDVLIIDEVLSVGDFAFQERAFGRIRHLAQSGMPVVIVSHQLEAVADLCTHVILLEQGNVVCSGSAAESIAAYVRRHRVTRPATAVYSPVEFRALQVLSGERVLAGEWCTFRLEGIVSGEIREGVDPLRLRVRSLANGEVLFISGAHRLNVNLPERGPFSVDLRLQANVAPGAYSVEVCAFDTISDENIAWAPPAVIGVSDPGTFHGAVQLNAEMHLTAAPPGAAAAH